MTTIKNIPPELADQFDFRPGDKILVMMKTPESVMIRMTRPGEAEGLPSHGGIKEWIKRYAGIASKSCDGESNSEFRTTALRTKFDL